MAQWMGTDNVEDEIKNRFKKFPEGSQLTRIDNSGHMIHLEQPEALSRILKDFLQNRSFEPLSK